MDGIINVYKEAGFTSHDVVAKLRGILGQKKIGHTGTLDPMATGVLPVCCGKATKVCGLLTEMDKTYQAVCRLGIVTDTQDMEGTVLEENSVRDITESDVRKAAQSFRGEILQVPPMYSAVKVQGKKLYEFARAGKTVERKARQVTVWNIKVLQTDLSGQIFSVEVTCSKGTYIRTLCHDIGQKLGVGAAVQNLVRTRVGSFSIGEALTLKELERLYQEDTDAFQKHIYSVESLFGSYPRLQVKDSFAGKLANGNQLAQEGLVSLGRLPKSGEDCLIYDEKGNFKAIYHKEGLDFTVVKMF